MDFSKIKNSKIVKWTLIIGLPTVLVAGYYGYKYLKNRNKSIDELEKDVKEKNKYNAKMRGKFKDIKTVDDFIKGVKYLENDAPFGYSLGDLESKKTYLMSVNFNDVKEMYRLLNNGLANNSEEENMILIKFLEKMYGN